MQERKIFWLSAQDLPQKNVFGRDLAIKNYRQYLGQTRADLFWDASNGLYPNAFASMLATIPSGKNLYLHLPENYQNGDPDHLRFLDFGSNAQGNNYFNKRLLRIYQQSKSATEISASTTLPSPKKPELLHPPLLVLGKRGRGKSFYLANLAQKLAPKRLLICAPFASNLQEYQKLNYYFLPPDEALRLHPECDLLIIDEAAAIPIKQLQELIKIYPHYLLASSSDGYEGQRNDFMINFLPNLANIPVIYLDNSWRYQNNDELERWAESAFLYDCTPENIQEPQEIKCVNNSDFYHDESLLRQVYSLLRLAHYRSSPEDLKRLLDLPNQCFYLAINNNSVAGVLWLVLEEALPDELALAVINQQRRPRGRIFLQQLLINQQNLKFNQAYWRISRIAIAENFRRQKWAQRLINQAQQDLQQDFGTIYQSRADLNLFWQALDFKIYSSNSNNLALRKYKEIL